MGNNKGFDCLSLVLCQVA